MVFGKNKHLCFANCDFSPFNINVSFLRVIISLKKCNADDLQTKQKAKK